MQYVLTYSHLTAAYKCHASTCRVAVTTKLQTLISQEFSTVEAAKSFADMDESEKAGEPTEAYGWKVCKCAKVSKQP